MGTGIKLCFGVTTEYQGLCGTSELDALFQTLKRLCAFLYAHPKFSFFWSVSGVQLEYYSKKHPEFISLLSQLINRKQSELLGGGYFEPMLPVLLSVDRTGQIEKFTTFQRGLIGKRPRGIWMPRMWDMKIIDSLKNCGIDYVLLDSELVGTRTFSPLILEHTGKTVYALPVFQNLMPDSAPEEYLKKIISAARHEKGGSSTAVIMLSPERIDTLMEQNWFEEFFSLCAQRGAEIVVPSQCFREPLPYAREFIAPVMKNGTNIYDYLQKRPTVYLLYARMINVSVLVNQCRGDKSKKQYAREKLMQAQAGAAYYTDQDFETILAARKSAFGNLIQAEKIVREVTGFHSSVINFDADFDGANEYVCRFETYNAFITKKGGSVYELDVFKSCANYADTRVPQDFFIEQNPAPVIPKNIFVDHIIENSASPASLENDSLFALANYSETFFSAKRKEFKLVARENFGAQKQKISLIKNYLASENGLQVQYIIKNESDFPLTAALAVESSLSMPAASLFNIDLVADNENQIINAEARFEKKSGVSHAVFSDEQHLISFMFEANENAGFYYAPVCYSGGGSQIPYAAACVFSWKINLLPNMETEKTINLNIVTSRKKRK